VPPPPDAERDGVSAVAWMHVLLVARGKPVVRMIGGCR
jgi:hypothetical protein